MMRTRKSSLGNLENLLICGVPYSIYGAGDNVVCMRLSDGVAIALTYKETKILSRLTTVRPLGQWLEALCRQELEERLEKSEKSIIARLLRWASSVAEDSATESRVKICEAMYDSYLPDIRTLMTHELLVPVDKLFQEMISARKVENISCRISALCIPTCERSSYLSRCVSSFSAGLRAHGRSDARILVVDDSANESSERRNREVVSSFTLSDRPLISFVGHKERQDFIKGLLAKNAAPPDVIRFALNSEKLLTTEGSVRNTIMLLTCGEYILQTDDDTSCDYVAGLHSDAVAISAMPDPYQTYFYSDRKTNLKEFPVTSGIDPFSIHESTLGRSLSDVILSSDNIKWNGAVPNKFLGSYAGGSRVDVTTTGVSGDPGMSSCWSFLFDAPTETLKRIYSSPESYKTATNVREVLRIAPELTMCRGGVFQAMSFAINNTHLQPPFFPVGRGLDDAFALLYFHSDVGSLIGHIPFAITHVSESDRQYEGWPSGEAATATWCKPYVPLTYFVKLCIEDTRTYDGASMDSNLKSIGEQMIAIGSMSQASFKAYIREKHVSKVLGLAAHLDENLNGANYRCEKRIHNTTALIGGFRRSIVEPRAVIPCDFPSTIGVDDALDKIQAYIVMYGKVLTCWEHIVASAGEIRPTFSWNMSAY